MQREEPRKYHRLAIVLGLAMALGPLTALTLNSTDSGDGVAGTLSERNPLASHDNTRTPSAEVSGKSLADVATASGSLDYFSSVLQASGVKEMLRADGQYTVFIPVNEAFRDLGPDSLSSLLRDDERARAMAKAHVVPGRVTATDLMGNRELQSLNGHRIASRAGADLTVNGATVIASEAAANGIVHYVDRVL